MNKRVIYFYLLIFLTASFLSAKGIGSEAKVRARKLNSKIILDGNLTESIWTTAPIKKFIQRDPEEGMPATETTNVWVAYDSENIYIAARLRDSHAEQIDASLTRKDNVVDSDWFIFYVDPYNDKRTGYFFGANAGGSMMDGILYNDSWNDDSWDGIWEAETQIDSEGWSVEMKIPFSQLRFKESDAMTWGVNFQRIIKRKNEESYFIMVPKEESGFVSHFAALEGLNGIKPSGRFEVFPYVVQRAQYLKHSPNDPFYKQNQYKTALGADIKFSLGTNLNVDATINPDFGQVEVDPAVVNLTAFESYFPEKRPFFIEGSNIFRFGQGGSNNNWGFNFGTPTLFYSRRIGGRPHGGVSGDYVDYPNESRILGAAKLTGKIDETWSIGAVSAITERTYAASSTNGLHNETEVEPFTHYGVLRSRKEFNSGKQALGFIFTSVNRNLRTTGLENSLSKQAYTFGLDGWTFLDEDEEYVLTGYAVGSYVSGTAQFMQKLQQAPTRYFQRPDATFAVFNPNRTSMTGLYSRVMLNKQKGNFYINTAFGLVTPGFEYNDLGFQWNADKINGHLVLGYRWFEPDEIFRRKWFYIAHAESYDFEGNNISNFFMTFANFQLLNYYGFGFNLWASLPSITKGLTRGGPLAENPAAFNFNFNGNSDSRNDFVSNVNIGFSGDQLGSSSFDVGYSLTWKPNTQINVSFGPSYSQRLEKVQWVTRIVDILAASTFNNRYIFAEMTQKTISGDFRMNWTFTPRLSLQLFFQPLISVGDYENFKELSEPASMKYNVYGKNGSTIQFDKQAAQYEIDPDGNGPAAKFAFGNPDFNFKSVRANVVLRYEINPGSIFYFVWTHDRMNFDNPGELEFSRDLRNLIAAEPDNVFLVKFSYFLDI